MIKKYFMIRGDDTYLTGKIVEIFCNMIDISYELILEVDRYAVPDHLVAYYEEFETKRIEKNINDLTSEELDKILLAAKRITIYKGELSGEIFVSDEEYVAFGADESEGFLNEIRRLIKREEPINKIYNPVTKKWKEIKEYR